MSKYTNFLFGILFSTIMLPIAGFAQQSSIEGPTFVQLNTTHTYYLTGDVQNVNWELFSGGVILGYGPDNKSITINWYQAGVFQIGAGYETGGWYSYASQTISVAAPLTGGTIVLQKNDWVSGVEMEVINSVSAAAGGFCSAEDITYRWEYSYDNINFIEIPFSNSVDYKAKDPIRQTTYYRRYAYCIYQGTSESDYSNTVAAVVVPSLAAGLIGPSQTVLPTVPPQMLSTIQNPVGGTGTYSYQWEQSADGLTWEMLPGATNTNFQPSTPAGRIYYRRKVTSGVQFRYSNVVKISSKDNVPLNKPANTVVTATAPVKQMPDYSGVSSADLNRITQYDIIRAGITSMSEINSLSQRSDFFKSTVYFDGIGRPIQTVAHQESVTGKDLVSVSVYDKYGYQQLNYLPYLAATDGSNVGSFRSDAATAQSMFYKDLTQNTEEYFYFYDEGEVSGLSRINKSMAPGKSFAGSENGPRQEARTNTIADKIRIWVIGDDQNALPYSIEEYAPGVLNVIEYTNEKEEIVTSYFGSGGGILCQSIRPVLDDVESNSVRTYFVYNDFGQLRAVISPLASRYCKDNDVWNLDASPESRNIAKELCYRYIYNDKGILEKKYMAGADGPEFFIHDARGRLTFSQNELMRQASPGEWLVYFYDEMDRPVITGTFVNPSATFESLEQSLAVPSGNSSISFTHPPIADLYLDKREGGTSKYEATNSITFTDGFESELNAEFTAEINASPIMPTETFIVSNPSPAVSGYNVLSVIYYDNYNWAGARQFSTNFQTSSGSNNYVEAVTPRKTPTGKVTGIRRAIKGANRMLISTFYYDEIGRQIQRHSENIAGGIDVATRQFNFSGHLVSSFVHHRNPKSKGTPELKVLTAYEYEDGRRLKEVRQTLVDQPGMNSKLLTSFSYDDLGRVKAQTLGNLETLEFDYDFHGRLTGLNKAYTRNKTGQHYFGMELAYEAGFEMPEKGGGVSGVTWRRKGNEDEWHAYGYNYDNQGRLIKADYTQNTAGIWTNDIADFKEAISSYDDNGNVRQLIREGMLLGNVKSTLDNLNYTYLNGSYSNKLHNVSDDKGDQRQGDFKDVNDGNPDYVYDPDGNVIGDRNRGITIAYDYLLNKPVKITFDNFPSKSIEYVYSVGGTKLEQIVKDGSSVTTYTYIDGFVYKNDELMLFPHGNGRVRKGANGQFVYDYFITDHVGNVRTVLTEETNEIFYRATHEDAPQPVPAIPEREAFNFTIDPENIPAGHKLYDYGGTNRKYIRLNSDDPGRKIGTSKVLRVMAGDVVETGVMAYYAQNSPNNNVPDQPVNQILSQLISALLGPATSVIPNGHDNLLMSNSNGTILNTQDMTSFINSNRNGNPPSEIPKAYLNYVLFDDNFKMVNGGVVRVSTPDEITPLVGQLNISKNGYVYIYVSNESPTNVYFDNLVVKHTTGHLLQEDSYYPNGLGIRALSSKALSRLKNDYLFNGIEKISDFDLEIYDAYYRNLDPQVGRWWQRDPAAEKYANLTPYNLNGNNPAANSDPLGDDWFRSRNGKAYIWKNSTSSSEIINGELYDNIGMIFSVVQGNYRITHVLQETIIQELSSGAIVSPYYKGQQEFASFLINMASTGGVEQLSREMSAAYLSSIESYRGVGGGVNSDIEDQVRSRVNIEIIPTIKEAWARSKSGYGDGFLDAFNILGRVNHLQYRAHTALTNDDALDIVTEVGVEVAMSWIAAANFPSLKKQLSMKPKQVPEIGTAVSARAPASISIESPAVLKVTPEDVGLMKFSDAAAKGWTTVLGHYPQYVKVAETIGARTFQIPTKIWNKMSPAEQWAANQKFLDRMILRGDNIRLATPLNQVKPGSFFEKELNYLFDKGYKVSSDGLWLFK